MEADYGFSMGKESSRPGCNVVHWNNDWHKFKRLFKATGRLNGIAEALKYAEILVTKASTNVEGETDIEQEKLQLKAIGQSPRLAALLTLAIANSEGAQQSIIMDELENDEDGITAWIKLITHFEQSTQEVRVDNLLYQWENEVLQTEEHPDQLYGRLTSMRTKLQNLGETISDANLTRRFVSAIGKEKNNKYKDVITFYRGQIITGNPCTISSLREFLSYVHVNEPGRATEPTMKGLASITKCTHCGKIGHKEDDCWNKYPKNGRFRNNGKRLPPQPIECWACGKAGHVKRNCPNTSKNKPHISAGIVENVINENDVCNYIDSASSIHLVTSIDLLRDVMEVTSREIMQTVGGEFIKLTHKGNRLLVTRYGSLQMSEVYYAKGVRYNLISVPKLVEKGISLHLRNKRAYIEKQGVKINLERADHGLWTMYTNHPHVAASLRLELGGKTDAKPK